MAERASAADEEDEFFNDMFIPGEQPAYLGNTPVVRKLDDQTSLLGMKLASDNYWEKHEDSLDKIKKAGHDVVTYTSNHGRAFMIGVGVATAAAALGIGAIIVHKHKKKE